MKIFVYGFVRIDRDLCSSCKKYESQKFISMPTCEVVKGIWICAIGSPTCVWACSKFQFSKRQSVNSREKQNTIQDACPSSTWTQSVLYPINIEPMLSMDSTVYLLDLAGSIRLNESQANPTKTAIGEN
jgi:hypothetical protein